MAAGLSFSIKGDSTGFVSSVKKAEKTLGGLADKVRGIGFGKLSNGLAKASSSLNSFARSSNQKLSLSKEVANLDSKLDKLGKRKTKVGVDLKSAKALAKFKALQEELKKLQSKKKTVKLTVKEQELIAGLKRAKASIKRLQADGAAVNLRLNSKQALAKVKQFGSQLKRIQNKTVLLKAKRDNVLPQYKSDLLALAVAAAAIKFVGFNKLKGKSPALDKIAGKLGKIGAAAAGKMAGGLAKASKAMAFLAKSSKRAVFNKALAGTAVVSLISLKAAATVAGQALGKLGGKMKKLASLGLSSLKNLTFATLKAGAIGATAAVVGLVVALKSAVANASGIENMGVAFTAITGSVKGSTDLITHLREESKRTGVEMGTMATMVRRLMANGMDISAAKKMTSSLLDISGTLGLGTEEAKLLGIAISQVQAKGVVSMEELRQQIAEKGVPVFDVLAQKLGVTKGELMDMVAAGKVGSEVLMEAFSNLEGPLAKFRGGAEKMGMTAQGSFNRLKATMADVFAVSGAPLLDGISVAVNTITQKLTEWGPKMKAFAEGVGSFVRTLAQAFKQGQIGEMVKLGLVVAAKGMISTLWSGLKAWVATLFNYMVEAGKMMWGKITDMTFWQGIGEIFRGAGLALEVAGLKLAKALSPGSTRFDNAIKQREGMSGLAFRNGMDMMGRAGDGRTPADVLKEQVAFFKGVFEDAQKDPLLDGSKELDRLKDIYEAMRKLAEEDKKKREEAMTEIPKNDDTKKPKKKGDKMEDFYKPIVTSMQRIGGASIKGLGAASLAIRRNSLLERIAQSTADALALHKQNREKPDNKDVAVGGSLSTAITSLVIKSMPKPIKQEAKVGGSLASMITGEVMKVIGANQVAMKDGWQKAIKDKAGESTSSSIFGDEVMGSIKSVTDAFLKKIDGDSENSSKGGVPEVDPDKYQPGQNIVGRITEASKVGVSGVGTAITDSMKKMMPNQNNAAANNDPFLKLDEQRNVLLKSIDKQIGKIGGPAVFA